jgi:hypothetical protein
LNSSFRASSSIMMSFMMNSTPLPVRYSASALQGPQKGCEYTVICCWSFMVVSVCLCLQELLLRLFGFLFPCFL